MFCKQRKSSRTFSSFKRGTNNDDNNVKIIGDGALISDNIKEWKFRLVQVNVGTRFF